MTATEKWLDGFDSFAAGVPGFNFEGRTQIHSPIGVILSFILSLMLTGIFALRLIKFVSKSSTVSVNLIDLAESDEKNEVNLKENNFSIAFQVVDYLSHEVLHDKSLVDWEVHIYEGSGIHKYDTVVQ